MAKTIAEELVDTLSTAGVKRIGAVLNADRAMAESVALSSGLT